MENKFKVGDYARRVLDGAILRIDVIKDDWIAYCDKRIMTGACSMEEVEPIDTKTAFLSELKELLSKYDAKITADSYEDCPMLSFAVGDDTIEQYCPLSPFLSDNYVELTADNIMDYEKE